MFRDARNKPIPADRLLLVRCLVKHATQHSRYFILLNTGQSDEISVPTIQGRKLQAKWPFTGAHQTPNTISKKDSTIFGSGYDRPRSGEKPQQGNTPSLRTFHGLAYIYVASADSIYIYI